MKTLNVEETAHHFGGLAHFFLAAGNDGNTKQGLVFTQSSVDTRYNDVSKQVQMMFSRVGHEQRDGSSSLQ